MMEGTTKGEIVSLLQEVKASSDLVIETIQAKQAAFELMEEAVARKAAAFSDLEGLLSRLGKDGILSGGTVHMGGFMLTVKDN